MRSDLVDIECYIMQERPDSVAIWDGVSFKEYQGRQVQKWVWLPRSAIEIMPNGKTFTVTVLQELALEKGLI